MPLEVDHAFIACAREAPEADALLRAVLSKGRAIPIPVKAPPTGASTSRTSCWN